jgi:hypothetical protein
VFYDLKGREIKEGSVVEFYGEEYTIVKINGDRFGLDGTSTLKFDRKPHIDKIPCEGSINLVIY